MDITKISVGSFLLLLAIAGVFFALNMFKKASASASWPKTEGTITVSELDTSTSGAGKAKARIEYRYSVDGREYTGSRVRFGDMTGSGKPFQQAIVDAYPKDKAVNVFYDPENAEVSVLEAGSGLGGYAYFLIPLALFAAGGFLLATGLIPPPKQSRLRAGRY